MGVPAAVPLSWEGVRMSVRSRPTCPRCRSLLRTERDVYGTYSSCLMCGYVHEWGRPPADLRSAAAPAPGQRRREPSHGRRKL